MGAVLDQLGRTAVFLNAPLRGKGDPGAIALEAAKLLGPVPLTPEAARTQLKSAGIGIDCSGFVYHVIDYWLAATGHRLADELVMTKEEITVAMEKYPDRPSPVDGELPELIQLSTVCEAWSKQPADAANVARLVNPASVAAVTRAGDMRPGDMIKLTGTAGDHIGVVVETAKAKVVYYSADDPETGLGGPARHEVELTNPDAGMEEQNWSASKYYHPGQNRDGVWRLRLLA